MIALLCPKHEETVFSFFSIRRRIMVCCQTQVQYIIRKIAVIPQDLVYRAFNCVYFTHTASL